MWTASRVLFIVNSAADIVHLKEHQTEVFISIISLLSDLQPAMQALADINFYIIQSSLLLLLTNLFGSRSPLLHSSLFATLYCLNIVSDHLQSSVQQQLQRVRSPSSIIEASATSYHLC